MRRHSPARSAVQTSVPPDNGLSFKSWETIRSGGKVTTAFPSTRAAQALFLASIAEKAVDAGGRTHSSTSSKMLRLTLWLALVSSTVISREVELCASVGFLSIHS